MEQRPRIQLSFRPDERELVDKYYQLCEEFGINLGKVIVRAFIYDLELFKKNGGLRPGRMPYFNVQFNNGE